MHNPLNILVSSLFFVNWWKCFEFKRLCSRLRLLRLKVHLLTVWILVNTNNASEMWFNFGKKQYPGCIPDLQTSIRNSGVALKDLHIGFNRQRVSTKFFSLKRRGMSNQIIISVHNHHNECHKWWHNAPKWKTAVC